MQDRDKIIEYLVYGLLIMALLFGGFPIFTIIYVLVAIYLCYKVLKSECRGIDKLFRCGIYIGIMSCQLTLNALIIYDESIFLLIPMGRRLIATFLIFLPFIIEKYVIVNRDTIEETPSVDDEKVEEKS
ncbi:MAG: hypothetical protein MJA31_16450 [Clostridia bacterium]|nr:hypothetical protein [Clostridia bacterium]